MSGIKVQPYKFMVQGIVQRLDDDGNVIGEVAGQVNEVYGCAALAKWADDFPDILALEASGDTPAA